MFNLLYFKHFLQFIYKIMESFTSKNIDYLFIETHEKKISYSFQALYNRMTEDEKSTYVFFADELNRNYFKRIYIHIKAMYYISKSNVIILNDGYKPLNYFSECKLKIVQLWHGPGAFKKFGYSLMSKEFGDNAEYFETHPIHKNYTIVTTSSENVNWAYEEAFKNERSDIVQALGIPRTDFFFNSALNYREKLIKEYDLDDQKKIIAYVPTFRGKLTSQTHKHYPNFEYLKEYIENDYYVLYSLHPLVTENPLISDSTVGFLFNVVDVFETHELIKGADIILTDYSSVVFEASLLDKPIMFFVPDIEDYRKERDFYYKLDFLMPGPIAKNDHQLLTNLESISYDSYKQEISNFKKYFMNACDGNSTERVYEKIKHIEGDLVEK